MPEKYHCEDIVISLGAESTSKDLTKVVKQLLTEECTDEKLAAEISKRKFNFMVNNTFLSTTLQDLLEQLEISNENVVEIYYLFALEKPKPSHSSPEDEWISTLNSLNHLMNSKAKSYVAGFFNGDLKVYD